MLFVLLLLFLRKLFLPKLNKMDIPKPQLKSILQKLFVTLRVFVCLKQKFVCVFIQKQNKKNPFVFVFFGKMKPKT